MQEYKMAKSITFFDKEHTGGINLAAMEDTQLKENLVKDIAAGGNEAPTATAVKEAIEAKMGKVDIINDLTTGGTDKALSAEQGKVLDEKKADKVVTPASVYVTEGSKPLSEFAMKAEVTDFVELDSASMPNTLATLAGISEDGIFKKWVYVDTAELGTAKDGDIVQLTVAGKNYFGILGGPQVGTGAAIDDEMLNTTLPASGNWQGWSRIYIANSVDNVKVVNKKVDKIDTPDSVYTTNGSKPLSEFVVDSDIINDLTTGGTDKALSAEQGKVLEGKKVDKIDTPDSVYTTNGSKPLAEFATFAEVGLSGTGETFISMPNLNGFRTDKGISSSTFFVHQSDLGDRKNTLKKGDIVSFKPSGQGVKGNVTAVFSHIVTEPTVNGDHILNETGNDFNGWYAFTILSSDYDRVQMTNKANSWTIQVKSTDIQFKDTWAASKTGVIPNEACPSLNFMLTKDMMAQIPNAKVGDSIYLAALSTDTGFSYNIYLYGRLHSLTAVNTPDFYRLQNNSGDIEGCGTLQVFSGNFLSALVLRKPNFFAMRTTTENSNIPVGLTSLSTIAFAPGTDTAHFAHALKQGDLIEVSNGSGVPYTLMFVRYATEADNASQKYLIVGQASEPADMTGYLFCRVFASIYDRDGAVPEVITPRYQPDQVEVGRRYNIQVRPSDPSDQVSINGITINSTNLTEFNFLVRMRFNSGAIFRLLLGSSIITMQVVTSTYSTDGRLTAICLSKGDRTVVRL